MKIAVYTIAKNEAHRCYRSSMMCSVDGCERPMFRKTWCGMHYQRWYRNGDVNAKTRLARGEAVGCSLDGCNRKHYAKTYCQLHYSRVKKDGSPGAVGKLIADDGLSMFVTKNGYLSTYHPETGRQILAHRLVMERVIGRPLYKHENVHHLNGDRQDNRPENLELWSSAQPSGQRIADKVAWAKWILAEYGDMA